MKSLLKRTGFRLALIAPLIVFGLWQWNSVRKSGVKKMAEELGSAGVLLGGLQVNHTNTKLIFAQHTADGGGLFLWDMKGEKQLVAKFLGGGGDMALLGWSPDDRYVGYVFELKLKMWLVEPGYNCMTFPVGSAPRGFTWLTPASFAVITNTTLVAYSRHSGKWEVDYVLPDVLDTNDLNNVLRTKATLLTRLGDHSVAWLREGSVWKADFGRPPQCLWAGETNPVLDFVLSPDSTRLLLNCGHSGSGGTLVSISPSRPGDVINLGHLSGPDTFVRQVARINHGAGFAYLSSGVKPRHSYLSMPSLNNTLFIKKTAEAKPIQIFGLSQVRDYTVGENCLYIIGNQAGEPCGVWKYDIGAETSTRIYPATLPKLPFEHSTFIARQCCYTTNDQGRVVKYNLWVPTVKHAGKKLPAMLSQTYYGGTYQDAQLAVQSGWCYAIADRPNWYSPTMRNWAEDVFLVYQDLVRKSLIDTNRVFLSATCGEQYYVNQLMDEHPGLWKGLFLPEAMAIPNLRQMNGVSVIAITEGHHASKRLGSLFRYEDRAAQAGIWMKFPLGSSEYGGFAASHVAHLQMLADLLTLEN